MDNKPVNCISQRKEKRTKAGNISQYAGLRVLKCNRTRKELSNLNGSAASIIALPPQG
jgi:hypothetical protein